MFVVHCVYSVHVMMSGARDGKEDNCALDVAFTSDQFC